MSGIIEPNETDILPDMFTKANEYRREADKYGRKDDLQRAFAYYRTIQARACHLLLQKANSLQEEVDCLLKNSNLEDVKIQKIAKKSELFRVEMIHRYLIPELKYYLEQKKFGTFQNGTSHRDGEKQYTGARQIVYGILTGRLNAGADLNGDGQVNTLEEARLVPCATIQEIEALWKEETNCNIDNLEPCTITGELLVEGNNSPTIFVEARLNQCINSTSKLLKTNPQVK